MRSLLLAGALAAFGGAGDARGADPVEQNVIAFEGGRYVVAQAPDLGCVIALQGRITKEARVAFDEAIERATRSGCPSPWLLLESPGGFLWDGIELGKAVRFRELRTVTRYDCASACGSLFLAGTERLLVGSRARIGFHQAWTKRGSEYVCAASPQGELLREKRSYLRWVVPASADAIFDMIVRTGCNKMEWVGGQRALDLGVATRLDRPDEDVFGPRRASAKRD